MTSVERLLNAVPVPRVVRVRQIFDRPGISTVEDALLTEIAGKGDLERIAGGKRVAIAVGSRGISNQSTVVAVLARSIRAAGGDPFIVPAMGSHGGATAEGQRQMLLGMGIDEVSAPIRATMDVVQIGISQNGIPVYIDAFARDADAIVVVNRVKPHVAFRGRYESGLMKMITIGLGKQKGAEMCHRLGMGTMAENIPLIARVTLQKSNILFAVALLENAYHETCAVEVVPAERIEEREPELLEESRRLSPRLYFDALDVLILDEIGKDISGTGFDTNVLGRYHTPYASGGPTITRIACLDITEKSHGNGNGLGILDFTTQRAFGKFRFDQTYPNSLTSTVPVSVKIPMVLANDRQAIQAAIKTSNVQSWENLRLARIKNTLTLDRIEVSENLTPLVRQHPKLELLSEPYDLPFDDTGSLL